MTNHPATVTKKSDKQAFRAHKSHLAPGQKAPAFEARDQHGNIRRLSDFSGKTLVLYFYPKDNTPTCTTQACSLRDGYESLGKKDYAVAGVSADSEASHARFASKHELPFPLLSDPDHKLIRAYDVWGQKKSFGRVYEGIVRTTFIISPEGIIRRVIHEVDAKGHAGQVMAPLEAPEK